MNLYLKGGILSLRQMKEHYNRFEDGGEVDNVHSTPEQAWMVNWINNRQEVLKENIRDTKDFPALYSDKRLSREAFEEAQKQSRRVLSVKQYNYGRGPQFPTVPDDLYKKARNNVVMSTGTYIPVDHSIIYNRYNNPGRTTQVHELTHSMGANPQLDMLLHDKNLPHKNLREGIEKSSYLDSYQEVYPRLMELRRFLNLDPKKRDYTPKDLEEMRKKVGNTNLLGRYSDKYLLNLLNNIASNKATIETDGRKLAAYGGPLRDEYDNPDQYYDYKTAEEVGNMYDPGTQHWASRDPRTGMILKNSKHPTFGMAIREDQSSGYAPFIDSSTGRYYTLRPEEYATAPNKHTLRKVNKLQDGGYSSPEIIPSKYYPEFPMRNYVETVEAQNVSQDTWTDSDIKKMIRSLEGEKNIAYLDSKGILTGGIGHKLSSEEKKKYPKGTIIPKDIIEDWWEQDYLSNAKIVDDLYPDAPSSLRAAMINTIFQGGPKLIRGSRDNRGNITNKKGYSPNFEKTVRAYIKEPTTERKQAIISEMQYGDDTTKGMARRYGINRAIVDGIIKASNAKDIKDPVLDTLSWYKSTKRELYKK